MSGGGTITVAGNASTGASVRTWYLTCLLSLSLVTACGEATDVARRVALDTVATEVAFDTPVVSAPGGELALCVEFDLPRDSHLASSLGIVLLARDGARTSWRGDADRTGESSVCLHGTMSPSQTYTGALVTAPRRMLLRRISWARASS